MAKTKSKAAKTAKSRRARTARPRARKNLAPVPAGMAWVSCYLIVKNPATAIAYYEKAFGFKKGLTLPGKDGGISHAELHYKDSTVMLGPENPETRSKAPSSLGGTPFTLYVYTEDVDGLTELARKAGGNVVMEPQDQFWGDRTCIIVDPEGYQWMFAKRVAEFDPSKAPR